LSRGKDIPIKITLFSKAILVTSYAPKIQQWIDAGQQYIA